MSRRAARAPSVWPWSAWSRSDRKSTRLNSSHLGISYAVFCLKKKTHHGRMPQRETYKRVASEQNPMQDFAELVTLEKQLLSYTYLKVGGTPDQFEQTQPTDGL